MKSVVVTVISLEVATFVAVVERLFRVEISVVMPGDSVDVVTVSVVETSVVAESVSVVPTPVVKLVNRPVNDPVSNAVAELSVVLIAVVSLMVAVAVTSLVKRDPSHIWWLCPHLKLAKIPHIMSGTLARSPSRKVQQTRDESTITHYESLIQDYEKQSELDQQLLKKQRTEYEFKLKILQNQVHKSAENYEILSLENKELIRQLEDLKINAHKDCPTPETVNRVLEMDHSLLQETKQIYEKEKRQLVNSYEMKLIDYEGQIQNLNEKLAKAEDKLRKQKHVIESLSDKADTMEQKVYELEQQLEHKLETEPSSSLGLVLEPQEQKPKRRVTINMALNVNGPMPAPRTSSLEELSAYLPQGIEVIDLSKEVEDEKERKYQRIIFELQRQNIQLQKKLKK
ncbi:hypothetical protein HDV04_001936 [Boothiomyces sp. JEL0838]|nr:hypothetical protein HDV04_001936 [Boothiomyces sp. JEL0838]